MTDSSDEEEMTSVPGWEQLKTSISKLQKNLNTLCDSLSVIVDIESANLINTGRVNIQDSSKRILNKQVQFMENFRQQMKDYKPVEIDSGEVQQEYAVMYKTLTHHVNKEISTLRDGIIKQLSIKTEAEKNLSKEFASLEKNFHQLETQLMKDQIKYDKLRGGINVEKARCKKLEEQLVEKSDKIKQLQRATNVALWEREKQKLKEDINTREEELASSLDHISGELDDTKTKLQNKIRDLQYQNSILKTRNNTRNGITRKEADDLKRVLFVKERSLIIAESEVKKQQIYYSGLLSGLIKDFQVMMSKDRISQEQYKHHHRDFFNKMQKISEGVEEGNLVSIRSSLPSHYLGADCDIKNTPMKTSSALTPVVNVNNIDEPVDLDDVEVNPSLFRWRKGPIFVNPSLKKLLEDMKTDHPALILKDGTLKMKAAMTYYPSYTEKQIQCLFESFKTLDDNGDSSLDTSEILHNLPTIIGRLATTEEVATAVREIDLDESGTIDFFEFLLLNRLLEQGEAKSKLLKQHSEHVRKKQEEVNNENSKVCRIM